MNIFFNDEFESEFNKHTHREYLLKIRKRDWNRQYTSRYFFLLVKKSIKQRFDPETKVLMRETIRFEYVDLDNYDSRFNISRDGYFDGAFDLVCKTVSITSSKAYGSAFFVLDPPSIRGHHIGTYYLDQLVEWAMQWPDMELKEITLMPGQANVDNKDRRNQLYQNVGIEFNFDNPECTTGVSKPMKIGQLRRNKNWQSSIQELNVGAVLADSIKLTSRKQIDIEQLEEGIRRVNEENYYYYRYPFRALLKRLLHIR